MQVHSFSSRSSEQSLRLMCLEHLGVIAARLRKDAISSVEQDHEELIDILAQVQETVRLYTRCTQLHVHVSTTGELFRK